MEQHATNAENTESGSPVSVPHTAFMAAKLKDGLFLGKLDIQKMLCRPAYRIDRLDPVNEVVCRITARNPFGFDFAGDYEAA